MLQVEQLTVGNLDTLVYKDRVYVTKSMDVVNVFPAGLDPDAKPE